MTDAPLLRFDRVSRIYGSGDATVRALDAIDLDIRAGEFVALMGASGSGKSTTLNIAGCLDTATSGRYWFRGVEVNRLSNDQRALLRRHYLGFVFQGFNLLPRTTALENVEMPLVYRGMSAGQRRAQALQALADVGLADRARHRPNELSGGQQQRVAVARALASQPSLLLADEPTGNLDTPRSHDLMQLLVRLRQQRPLTIVMVTHEPDMAGYADRVVQFRDGQIVADGPPDAGLRGARDAFDPARLPVEEVAP
ncbi:MAG: ABC transporter ATP-binding protein [Planctomycetota bacterium]